MKKIPYLIYRLIDKFQKTVRAMFLKLEKEKAAAPLVQWEKICGEKVSKHLLGHPT